ncbi:MAG: phosphate ABC transporter ATP-binding protein [Anaerolineae bacterium]
MSEHARQPVPPIFRLEDVAQKYNGRTVLDIDRLEVRQGEVLAIVGPSGAGKSTLLRLLAFLERPSRGRVYYAQRPCTESWPELAARRRVTMVFQRPELLHRSVTDNIAYGLRLRGAGDGQERIAAVVEQLGLSSLADVNARLLSGGEIQRVALARALVLQPEVLLLDEPTANLDPYNISLIEQIAAEANRQKGTTVVIVTHNIFQARRIAHRVALLLAGRLVEVSDTETFFNRPQRKQTAAFVRGEMIY